MEKSYHQLTKYNEQRNFLKERISQSGYGSFLDEEVISYITAIPVEKVRDYIKKYGIQDVPLYIDTYEITSVQRSKLWMLFEFSKRLAKAPFKDKVVLDSSQKAITFFLNELKFLNVETFVVAFLDNQNRLLEVVTTSKGTVNETYVYPREIIRMALLKNASGVILAHNHPGGILKPSQSDIVTTRKIKEGLEVLDLKLIDHIIVADGIGSSLAEAGQL